MSSSFSTAARSSQAAHACPLLPFLSLPPPTSLHPPTHTQAARSLLRGEIFFYEHLPSDIAHLFPSLVSSFSATQPRSPHRPPDEAAGFNVKDGPSANAPPSATPGSSEGRSTKPITAKALTPAELQSQVAAKLKVDDEADPACAAAAAATAKSAAPERDESGVASLTLQRIKGVTFSHLVTNRSLTPGRLVLLLKALRQLHSSSGDPNTLRPLSEISICANYLPKLRKRWKANKDSIYAGLSSDAPRMFAQVRASKHACSTQASACKHAQHTSVSPSIACSKQPAHTGLSPSLKQASSTHTSLLHLLSFPHTTPSLLSLPPNNAQHTQIEREMELFEKEERWQASNVIHGDPVFSNVLLTDDGRIFLLDMRGEQGNILTLQGDLTYDLSKVYQSLLGYDYIILGQVP